MKRRVVITGMGAITPLGHNVEDLFQSQVEGKSGVGLVGSFNASRFPTRFASQVKNFELSKFVKGAERWKASGVNSQFAVAAAQQALADANLLENSQVDRSRAGVYMGSGEGVQDFHNLVWLVAQHYDAHTRRVNTVDFMMGARKLFHREQELEQEPHTTTAHLADHFGFEGPNFNCLTACA